VEGSVPSAAPSVLVVDDNPDDLATFGRAVRELNVRLETASNGREGLKKALEANWDLIVLDYNLGDMTGTEILLRLKESGSPIPILIQSGIGSDFVVARALALGAEGFIAKDSPDYFGEVRLKLQASLARHTLLPQRGQGLSTERRPPVAELEEAIDDLLERSHGTFSAVGFASPDGFRVSTRVRRVGSLTPETICAMIASATSTSRFLGEGLGSRDLRILVAEYSDAVLLSAPVAEFGFLFGVSPTTGAKAQAARREFEIAIRELATLLDSLNKVQRYSS
jgi:CheY-like chemotaxis protein